MKHRSAGSSIFSETVFLRLLYVSVAVLSVLYSALSVVRHDRFQSGAFDLGIFDQTVWQYSRFIVPYNTIKERFILGDHLNLTLPLLAPLYWVWTDVRMLLVFQAVFITLSMIPVYRLTRLRGFPPFVSYAVSLLYILFFGIQYGVFFDFHPIVYGVGLLAWMLYFLESGRMRWFYITLVLALLTQENIPLAVTSLGFIYIFRPTFRKLAIIAIPGGIALALLMSKVIAYFSPVGFQYWPAIPHDPVAIVRGYFDAPEKLTVWKYSLGWFSFLPVLSPGAMLAVFFDLAQYFISGFSRMWTPFQHHRAILSLYLTLGTLDVLGYIRAKKRLVTGVTVVLLFVAAGNQLYFHHALNKLAKSEYRAYPQWARDDEKMIARIPPAASLAAQQSLVPHVSERREIYLAWPRQRDLEDKPCGQKTCWWLDFAGNPEYLFVDVHPNQWLTQLLETNAHFENALATMEKAGSIQLVDHIGDARLYHVIR